MQVDDHERQLILQAIAGDQAAMQKLLVSHSALLARHAERKLPATLQEKLDPEDIVQQTFVIAFRAIKRFEPEKAESFGAWLMGIADFVIRDNLKLYRRAKRGGQFQRVRNARPSPSLSVADVVELLSAGDQTPSYSVMGHEIVENVGDAIQDLPDDYRQAVELRVIQGKSLQETAGLMNRTPRAVQGLVDRAKKKLRATLDRLSKYR